MVSMDHEKNHSMLIDEGSKEQLIATAYERSYFKTALFHCIAILCFGLPYVLVYWHDVFGILWQCVQCPISQAQILILQVSRFLKTLLRFLQIFSL